MDVRTAIDAFLSTGSEFVSGNTATDQINVPFYYVDLWKLAGELNSAGLQETDYMLNPDVGVGRDQQLENLHAQIERALVDAGFTKSGENDEYVYYTRPVAS